jgi:hypothetical protein
MAMHGEKVVTKSEAEKTRVAQIQGALDNLSEVLNPVMGSVMNHAARVEMDRIFEATRGLLDAYWRYVTRRARLITMGLSQSQSDLGLTEERLPVEMVVQQPEVDYRFRTRFDLTTFTRREQTGTILVDRTRVEKRWYTLYLYPHEVSYQVRESVYGAVEYTEAVVPSVEQLIDFWVEQAQDKDAELVRQIVKWLIEQIQNSTEALRRSQEAMIVRYEARLEHAHAAAKQLHEFEQVEWGSVRDQADGLKSYLASLMVPPSREAQMAESSSHV